MNSASAANRPMDIYQFGREKLAARDIEPRATGVVKLKLGQPTTRRFVFAQSLFDHAGESAMIAEAGSEAFWDAAQERFHKGKRGGSRSKFRGQRCVDAMRTIQSRFPRIEDFFDTLRGDFRQVSARIQELPQYGPWCAFMLCDQAERMCKCKVDFSRVRVSDMVGLAVHGAGIAAARLNTSPEALLDDMKRHPWPSFATPMEDRPLNAQEIETLFCDYSHQPWQCAGSSARTVRYELIGYGKLAERLRNAIPGVLHDR